MMKKILLLITAAILSVSVAASVFAAGGKEAGDWKNLPGYDYINNNTNNNKDGKNHPITFSYDKTGLRFRCDGYYKVGNPNPNGYSGLILNTAIPVDQNGFKIKLVVNQFGGVEKDDCWVGFSLLDKPNMWDNNSAESGAGMVALLRPLGSDSKSGTNLMMYQLTKTQPIRNGYEKVNAYFDGFDNKKADLSKTVTFETKKEADGNYSVSLNGEKITTTTFDGLPWAVKNGGTGKPYLTISCSTDAAKYWDISIKEINGVSLAKTSGGNTQVSSQDAKPSSSRPSGNHSTSGQNQTPVNSDGQATGSNHGGQTGQTSGRNGSETQTGAQSGDEQSVPAGNVSVQENEGSSRIAEESSHAETGGKKKSNNTVIFVIIGVIVLALCGGGFFLYMKKFH